MKTAAAIQWDNRYSSSQNSLLARLRQWGKNYKPKTARVRFIVYWLKEDSEKEIKIVLPEVYFEKENNSENNTKNR